MANFFGRTLLSLVAACVAHGVTLAQDAQENFMEAVRLIRINKAEEGLQKLRAAVAADPSHEEAFELWTKANSQHGIHVWQMLLEQGGDYETLAKTLIDRATLGREAMSRDEAAIADLIVRSRAQDFDTRSKANRELAQAHGEFAVPQLLKTLGDIDAAREADLAILTLLQIGRPAVLPLIEALKSDNEVLRRNAAYALVEIGDARAAAPLARLVDDPSLGVRAVAESGLDKFGIEAGAKATDLLVRDARAYLAEVDSGEVSEVVWTWNAAARNVVPHDVPPALFALELAKMRAQDAMRIDPANEAASALVAQAYIAQASRIDSDPDLGEVADAQGRLHMAAMVLGRDTIRRAMIEAAAQRDAEAVEAIAGDLGLVEGGEIAGSPLIEALDSSETPIRYAAALSMARQATDASLPGADRVVDVLGEAVTEEALRAVLVIDGDPRTLAAAKALSARRGFAVRQATNGKEGVAAFLAFPSYDLVVLGENVDGADALTVAGLIKKRSPDAKIVLLAQSENAETTFEGKVDDFIALEGELTADQIAEKADELVESLDDRRARADKFAQAAGDALFRVAGAKIDIGAAAPHLAAQLDRDDLVAIPAARALGAGGSLDQAAALAALFGKEGASDDLKKTAADALGEILSRSSSVPSNVLEALIKLAADAEADIEVRQAAAYALGRSKLEPGIRLKLVELLRAVPASGGA
jgi:HEAT repeat protein